MKQMLLIPEKTVNLPLVSKCAMQELCTQGCGWQGECFAAGTAEDFQVKPLDSRTSP